MVELATLLVPGPPPSFLRSSHQPLAPSREEQDNLKVNKHLWHITLGHSSLQPTQLGPRASIRNLRLAERTSGPGMDLHLVS